ncbi:MAG: energy transducer TonB [Sphingomicrobium sp.]
MLMLLTATTQNSPADRLDWRWDRATPICALQQTSASGDLIEVSRMPTNDQTSLEITLQSGSDVPAIQGKNGSVSLNPGRDVAADVYAQADEWKRLHIRAMVEDRAFPQEMANASSFGISGEQAGTFKAPLRSASAAMAALQICEDEKMRMWGIDPVAWRGLKSHPILIKPLDELLSEYDYPGMAAAFGVTGDVIARLDVTSDGRVKQCKSLNPMKYNGFELATCSELKKARFQPARDAAGNPVSAPYVVLVSFRYRRQ